MKKSQTVSYTSEELKQRIGQSDWAASAAMSDEEIEAAIASDPEEADRHAGWLKRARVVRAKPRYVMCINNKDNEASLTLRRVYRVIPDEDAAARKMVKLVDDTGGEHLFPTRRFVSVELSVEAERNFELVVA